MAANWNRLWNWWREDWWVEVPVPTGDIPKDYKAAWTPAVLPDGSLNYRIRPTQAQIDIASKVYDIHPGVNRQRMEDALAAAMAMVAQTQEQFNWIVTLKDEWCYGPFKTEKDATDFIMANSRGSRNRQLRDWDVFQVISPQSIDVLGG